ncbi:MBL fold metallo-hydrolase [Streptomyces cinereoruber]|uniref:MBL fold metallo-hydrolase n=1 Tax=Streptomyces cinereoruber TaxID=67260 RepID=A0ABX6BL86_9ACTN|nr:MBL fold metallo-hydrolase [Streptomyces cinereoruber]MBB4162317.1 glyoxylase-like metal-dependent hydrolase (beta-lactamase superfamily II) [Streptomyces cinereoruber]MBY8820107.1 MBL fold metallo-hydrolase [Streptomyces cinereoruber]QEV36073.1 MBL fold metallo-hydrolase [Streptomyces cinereoruber]
MTARFDQGAWAESGVQTVQPGVHRVPLPLPNDGLHAVNVYLLEGLAEDGRLVMIDGGWAIPEARKKLEEALAVIGRDLFDIGHILVTHVHRDHYTQAVELRRLLGARVCLGAGERRGLELLNEMRGGLGSALRTLRRAGAEELAELVQVTYPDLYEPGHWEAPDRWLGAETLRFGPHALRVIPTPGHTRGHVVFLDERRRLMFSGDHVLPRITPSIGFEASDPGGRPLASYLESLRLMTDYADTRLLPAHGPVGESTHTRVAELVAHHDDRLARTLAVVGDDTRDAFSVARGLVWTRRELAFGALSPLNQMLAVNETVAHLDVLALRGRVAVSSVGGVNRYTRMR